MLASVLCTTKEEKPYISFWALFAQLYRYNVGQTQCLNHFSRKQLHQVKLISRGAQLHFKMHLELNISPEIYIYI